MNVLLFAVVNTESLVIFDIPSLIAAVGAVMATMIGRQNKYKLEKLKMEIDSREPSKVKVKKEGE